MRLMLLSLLVGIVLIGSIAFAATPQLVSVHGKLTDTANNPYSGSKNLILRIFTASSGGSPVYTEFWNTSTQQVTLATGGYFSILMGSQTTLTLPFDQQYWLEINVEGETLSPRYKLGSTPYTYRANITENLAAGTNASGNLNMNSFNLTNAAYVLGSSGLCIGSDCKTAWSQVGGVSGWTLSGNSIFNSSANVGIGLSAPSSRLHLNSSGDITIFNASNGTVNAGLFLGTLSGGQAGASIGTNSNSQFRLFTGGTDRLTVDTNGNVGIGTASPGAKLDVQVPANTNALFTSTAPNKYTNVFYNTAGSAAGFSQYDSTPTLKNRFLADGDSYITGGNVGIGTTSPPRKLTVSGGNLSVTNDTVARSDIYWDATNNRLVIRVN